MRIRITFDIETLESPPNLEAIRLDVESSVKTGELYELEGDVRYTVNVDGVYMPLDFEGRNNV